MISISAVSALTLSTNSLSPSSRSATPQIFQTTPITPTRQVSPIPSSPNPIKINPSTIQNIPQGVQGSSEPPSSSETPESDKNIYELKSVYKNSFRILASDQIYNLASGLKLWEKYDKVLTRYCPGKGPKSFLVLGGWPPDYTFGGPPPQTPPECKNGAEKYTKKETGEITLGDSLRIDSLLTNNKPDAMIMMTPLADYAYVLYQNGGTTGKDDKNPWKSPAPTLVYRATDGFWYIYF